MNACLRRQTLRFPPRRKLWTWKSFPLKGMPKIYGEAGVSYRERAGQAAMTRQMGTAPVRAEEMGLALEAREFILRSGIPESYSTLPAACNSTLARWVSLFKGILK